MGQKANLITLRKLQNTLIISEENSKILINILEFLRFFILFLQQKNILVLKTRFTSAVNTSYIQFHLFYRATRCNLYKKFKFQEEKTMQQNIIVYNNSFQKLFKSFFKNYNKNFFSITFLTLNFKLKKKVLYLFYYDIKAYFSALFERRYSLFIDFIKFSGLLGQNLITATSYLFMLSQILRYLTKRSHTKFLSLLKKVFETFVAHKDFQIYGFKFIINGKLKGKTRADTKVITSGRVACQTLTNKVEFGVIHTNTLFGVFGMRLWLYRK